VKEADQPIRSSPMTASQPGAADRIEVAEPDPAEGHGGEIDQVRKIDPSFAQNAAQRETDGEEITGASEDPHLDRMGPRSRRPPRASMRPRSPIYEGPCNSDDTMRKAS
jgi:hypothetical protein